MELILVNYAFSIKREHFSSRKSQKSKKKNKLSNLPLIFTLITTCLLHLTSATHGVSMDCYSCAQMDDGNRYICNWLNAKRFNDPNHIACCTEDNESEYCNRDAYTRDSVVSV